MKKNNLIIVSLLLLILVNACSGYKPIFSTSNFNFIISDYSITGNQVLGNKIYYKLRNISESNKKNDDAQTLKVSLNVAKKQEPTIKDSAGKIIEYRITLRTNVSINNYLTNEEILNDNFTIYSNYKIQDQHTETKKLENKTLENLIDKTYQDILFKISEKFKK
jgi:hypothetical protein